jgi:hypothetical protein
MRESWSVSPQRADPLSWFTGPHLPLLLGVGAVAQGAVSAFSLWNQWGNPWLQIAALPLFLLAGFVTSVWTRANRPDLGNRRAFLALGIALVGFLVSAAGTAGGTVQAEHRWGAIGVAMILGSFAPFASARQMLGYAAPALLVVGAFGSAATADGGDRWHIGARVVIAVAPVLIATIASVVFAVSLVDRILLLSRDIADSGDPLVESAWGEIGVQSESLSRVQAQVAPFIRSIARNGVITDADRTLAAQLARELRADLVRAANSSWLDTVARETGLVVNDATGLADRMDEAQRAALQGLLRAVMDTPVVDRESLMIDLRAQPDGSTAVAVSLDVDLPEGRRILMLAPYYLTLKTTVDNLSWAGGRSMLFKFQIPADRT